MTLFRRRKRDPADMLHRRGKRYARKMRWRRIRFRSADEIIDEVKERKQ